MTYVLCPFLLILKIIVFKHIYIYTDKYIMQVNYKDLKQRNCTHNAIPTCRFLILTPIYIILYKNTIRPVTSYKYRLLSYE